MSTRKATISRETAETRIKLDLKLDGSGRSDASTGVGFFDHMLDHIARHGLFDLSVHAEGDLHVDAHHTVEDVGICLGLAVLEALGDRSGIARYGHAVVPMDEVLAEVALDLSGRPYLGFDGALDGGTLGAFDVELVQEFMRAFANNARANLHVVIRRPGNLHHMAEGAFKAFGRALDAATRLDPRVSGVPSTKGVLEV
jgi:imidazoleglycerol-phosphate dehydratase